MALTKEDLQAIGDLIDKKLDSKLTPIQEHLVQVALTQENEVIPRIQLLLEGHSGLVHKLKQLEELPEQVEDIQATVSVLKHVFKSHTHS